ncbi:TPR-like protein [Pilatotrama ljubarskyi]|nr:TPR-like protein [Pilatotrama ljubarskyi]
MSSDADKQAQVEQLKAEGNALHVKGDYAAARSKYTDAIKLELDGENAVLYANRAATYIALKQYLDAGRDAQKAVEIDPDYGKAWARLAKATFELRVFSRSVQAWERALETLPAADLTPEQQRLREQYEDGLKKAEAELERQDKSTSLEEHGLQAFQIPEAERPWMRALKMEDVLTTNNVLNTSAWAIMNAYRDFSEGVRYMKQIKKTETGIEGNLNALQSIVSGILRDDRVFHMDSSDWLDLLQLQVQFELTAHDGWSTGGPETVKEEAVKRQKEKGWKAVRMALAATIRAWFLRAYFAHRSGESEDLALQYYNNVVDVLEWGVRTWHDVPTADRGFIFQRTFIRGIKRLRMEAYLAALKQSEDDSKYNVEDVIEIANQMVDETTKNVPKDESDGPMDKGAWYSFFVYPVAEAHAYETTSDMFEARVLGAVFMQQGLSAKQANEAEQAENMLAAAAKFYKKAAEMYPPDDENFPFYLKIAFEAELHRGRPLSETLALCERIRKSLPAVLKIWEFSPSDKLKHHMRQVEEFEVRAYTGLLEGKYTMETPSTEVPIS